MRRGDGPVEVRPPPRRRVARAPAQWLLLSWSRRTITLLLSTLIFVALLAVGSVWELEMEILVTETRAVQSLFNTLLGGVILFVSVVLSINTAVLVQEIGPLWTKQDRLEDSFEFRSRLEERVGTPTSPAEVGEFFRFVLHAIREHELRRRAGTIGDDELRRNLSTLVDDLADGTTTVERRLQADRRRGSTLLLAGLDYDAPGYIHSARHIREEHRHSLREPEERALTDLIEILKSFVTGREFFTTLYYKREVRQLSGDLLALALPVIVFTSYVLLAIDADLFPSATAFGIQPRLLYVSVAFVIALSPYVLLSAYMSRIVTVSRYSLGSGEFTLAEVE